MKLRMPIQIFLLACLWLAPALVGAQSPTTGQVAGVVKDASGAVISGARVTATNEAGVERRATTDESGRYAVPLLPPGAYRVEADKESFSKATAENVVVRITETTVLDIRLEVASQKASIIVTSEPPMVQTDTASRGDVISSETLTELPLPTRNFQQLLTLTPGTSSAISNSSDLGRGDTAFNVDGQRAVSNFIEINGIDANSIGTGSTPNLAVPATDTLQEFIVQTSQYDASQGRNAGGIVAAVTKSGTDQFHGNIYEFFRNDALDGNNFFLNAADVKRPPYKRNQFGGTLGGPVIKDRLWFFGSYQGTREVNGTSLENSIGTVFVPSILTSDRSEAALDNLAAAYGIAGCTPVTAGCLAAYNPTADFLLQAKLPNGQLIIPSAPANATGAVASVPVVGISRFREDQFNSNIDFKINAANRLSGKFFWANNPILQSLFNDFGLANALPVPGFGANVNFNQRVLSIDDTDVISPTLLNDLRFGYATITTKSTPQEPFTAAEMGISSPLGNLFTGMPEISVANYFDLGASPFSDNSAKEPTYTVGDTLTWQRGRHSWKFGVEYKHHELEENFNLYTRGDIFFLGFSGDPFKDFLGGFFDLTGLTIMGSGVTNRDFLSSDWAGFANDDWRVSDHLTLTLGVRYEYFGPFVEADGRYIGFDPAKLQTITIAPGDVAITGGFVQAANAKTKLPLIPTVQSSLVSPDRNNFAPRLGFAWQPFSASNHFVVRGGYGVYYDRPNSRLANNQILNFPYYTLAQAFTTPISNPFVQVPQPSAYPLEFNNSAIFPYGGPPAFLPAAVAGGVQAVAANGLYPDLHNFRTPYIQQYSFGIQDEFANNWLLDVSYVGSAGRKLMRLLDLNQAFVPVAGAPGPLSPGLSSLAAQGFGVHVMQSSSNSSYNSLQMSLKKRFSYGLQFLAAYTYSHSIDDYSGDPTGTSDVTVVPGNEAVLDNRASSDFDRRQRLVFSGIYDLPKFYKGDSAFGKQAANGWQVASIFTVQSGIPFSVLTAATAFVQARADFNTAAPNCNPKIGGSVTSKLNDYFNVGCFAPATVDFGDTGRNILVGPNQKDVDFSIVKLFPVTEKSNLEFRTEFFNIFNQVSFANPVNLLSSANVGQIVAATTGPRVVQFALKYNF